MANESRGREVDSVSLIPSMSPAPAKKRSTTAKKKKPKPTPNPYDFVSSTSATRKKTPTLMSLPNELLLNCLARVSRLYYPTLSLVSKRFRSLLASSELYKVRSLMGHTESCLYVCLSSHWSPCESFWFTLCLKPGKEKGYVLARVPVPYSRLAWFSDLVVVGSSIYQISSSFSTSPPSVSILDCRSHTWREAPSMRMGLMLYTPSVLDEKIYVVGYGKNGDSGSVTNTIEVFDTKTEIWDPAEPSPCSEIYGDDLYYKSTCIGGKLYVVYTLRDDVVAYNAKECRWDNVEWTSLPRSLQSDSYCEIDNVLYCVNNGVIRWCDTEVSLWSNLKGLVGLPEFPPKEVRTCVRLANYGGKMAVFWNKKSPNYRYNRTLMIWCAVITLERRSSCEIWGQVEWCGHVLTSYYDLEKDFAGSVSEYSDSKLDFSHIEKIVTSMSEQEDESTCELHKRKAHIRHKLTKEGGLELVKAGREDQSKTAFKQKKRGGSSNRHKKYMTL